MVSRQLGTRTRWRWTFSIKGLLAVTALFSVWLGHACHAYRVQRQAVSAIRKAGGEVYYGPCRTSPEPRWLGRVLPDDAFGKVIAVDIRGSRDQLQHLASLPDLRCVEIYGQQFSDDDVGSIALPPRLVLVNFMGTSVSRAGARELANGRPQLQVYCNGELMAGAPHAATGGTGLELTLGTLILAAVIIGIVWRRRVRRWQQTWHNGRRRGVGYSSLGSFDASNEYQSPTRCI